MARDWAANHTEPAGVLGHLLQRARTVPAERRAVLLHQLERPGGMPTTGCQFLDLLVRELAWELRRGGGLDLGPVPYGPESGGLDERSPCYAELGGLDVLLPSSAGSNGDAPAAVGLSLGTEALDEREVRLVCGGAGSKVDAPTALAVPLGGERLGQKSCCGAAESKVSDASAGPDGKNRSDMVEVRLGLGLAHVFLLCGQVLLTP